MEELKCPPLSKVISITKEKSCAGAGMNTGDFSANLMIIYKINDISKICKKYLKLILLPIY